MQNKKLKHALIFLVSVLAVPVIFYTLLAPGLILNIMQRTASSSLGTDVRIDSMKASLLRGRISLSGIGAANLEGFDAANILTVDNIEVSFLPLTILRDTFRINNIEVRGVTVYIQQKNGRNNLREFQILLADKEAVEEEDVENRKHFLVEMARIEDIVLNLDILGQTSSVEMDPVILEDIGSREEISAGILFTRVFGAVAIGAAGQMIDVLPAEEAGKMLKGIMEGVRDIFSGQEPE